MPVFICYSHEDKKFVRKLGAHLVRSNTLSIAVPLTGRLFAGQGIRTTAQDVESALSRARGETIRSGRMHIVFFGTDAGGLALVDDNGNPADILVIDDGRPGDLLQNCSVDGGEVVSAYTLSNGVTFGATSAGVVLPRRLPD